MQHVTINKKDETTDIICILDRSTSIRTSGLIDKTIEGFNAFLADQKKLEGKAKLTLCLFDGGSGYGAVAGKTYEIIHERVDINEVPDLNTDTFVPRGMTAMYDAIGSTIDAVYNKWKDDENRSDKVIFLIMTDGQENSSREYDQQSVFKMIQERKEKDKFVFLFIGANIDTMSVGGGLGVSSGNTLSYSNTGTGVTSAYLNMSSSVSMFRGATGTKGMAGSPGVFTCSVDTDSLIANNGTEKEEDLNK